MVWDSHTRSHKELFHASGQGLEFGVSHSCWCFGCAWGTNEKHRGHDLRRFVETTSIASILIIYFFIAKKLSGFVDLNRCWCFGFPQLWTFLHGLFIDKWIHKSTSLFGGDRCDCTVSHHNISKLKLIKVVLNNLVYFSFLGARHRDRCWGWYWGFTFGCGSWFRVNSCSWLSHSLWSRLHWRENRRHF